MSQGHFLKEMGGKKNFSATILAGSAHRGSANNTFKEKNACEARKESSRAKDLSE